MKQRDAWMDRVWSETAVSESFREKRKVLIGGPNWTTQQQKL